MSDLRKLADLLATFDRCERDRQPITPSMWDALRSLARKAADALATVTRERDEARAERDNERASFARALVAAHAETANALDALTWLVEQEIPCDAQGSYDSSFITNHAIALRTLIAAGRMVEIFDDGGRSVEAKMKPEPDAALAGAKS